MIWKILSLHLTNHYSMWAITLPFINVLHLYLQYNGFLFLLWWILWPISSDRPISHVEFLTLILSIAVHRMLRVSWSQMTTEWYLVAVSSPLHSNLGFTVTYLRIFMRLRVYSFWEAFWVGIYWVTFHRELGGGNFMLNKAGYYGSTRTQYHIDDRVCFCSKFLDL